MNKINVAINGFGRIGRMFFRLAHSCEDIEIIAINDISDVKTLAHLLKFDSVHGVYDAEVSADQHNIIVNGSVVRVINESDISKINWRQLGIDIVIESTGKFSKKKELQAHLSSGANKVILTSPPSDNLVKTVVLGINDSFINKDDRIISNASCTTHSAAPLIKIIDERFKIDSAYITTVHSFTNDQNLHDAAHPDLRRARSATSSIIPTTSGAAKSLTRIFPHLTNRIGGCGIRVPVPNASLTDLTCIVKKETTIKEINNIFKDSTNSYLGYTDLPLVSIDIIGTSYSLIFDAGLTSVIGKMIKVVAWYDNESGYSNRLIDLIRHL